MTLRLWYVQDTHNTQMSVEWPRAYDFGARRAELQALIQLLVEADQASCLGRGDGRYAIGAFGARMTS